MSLPRGLGKLPGSRVPEISHKSQDTSNCFNACLIFSSVPYWQEVPFLYYLEHCCLVAELCPTFCNPMDYIVHQASLPMELPRQEYQSGLPFPSPGDLPDPRFEPTSPTLAGTFFNAEPPGKTYHLDKCTYALFILWGMKWISTSKVDEYS